MASCSPWIPQQGRPRDSAFHFSREEGRRKGRGEEIRLQEWEEGDDTGKGLQSSWLEPVQEQVTLELGL